MMSYDEGEKVFIQVMYLVWGDDYPGSPRIYEEVWSSADTLNFKLSLSIVAF